MSHLCLLTCGSHNAHYFSAARPLVSSRPIDCVPVLDNEWTCFCLEHDLQPSSLSNSPNLSPLFWQCSACDHEPEAVYNPFIMHCQAALNFLSLFSLLLFVPHTSMHFFILNLCSDKTSLSTLGWSSSHSSPYLVGCTKIPWHLSHGFLSQVTILEWIRTRAGSGAYC